MQADWVCVSGSHKCHLNKRDLGLQLQTEQLIVTIQTIQNELGNLSNKWIIKLFTHKLWLYNFSQWYIL